MNQTENETLGVSFFDTRSWEEFFGDDRPSLGNLEPQTINLIENLPPVEILTQRIWEHDDYLSYVEELFENRESQGIINPHKAEIQYEMARLGINEETTRIIDPHNPKLLLGYTIRLLKQGKKEIWWSVADKDDITDPQGNTLFSPPLFKHITLSNLGQKYEELQTYLEQHSESLLKIFPQDGENPSLCSVLLVNEPGEKRLNFKIRPSRYTTDDRNEKEEPIEINIDLNGQTPIIIANKISDLRWLQVLINAQASFKELDKIKLYGSYYIQPEFMVYRNGIEERFSFFSDIVWGDKDEKSPANTTSPKFSPIFDKLMKAKVVLQKNVPVNNLIMQRHNLKYIFDQLKNPTKTEELWDQLRQIEQGDLPVNEMSIRTIALAIDNNLKLPKSARKIVLAYKAMDQIFRLNSKKHFFETEENQHRNNILYMHERLTIREILEFMSLIQEGKLANIVFTQIEALLLSSTKYYRSLGSFSNSSN